MALNRHTIQQGDTIQRIARRLLGQADKWWTLAVFNNLDYPYVDTSGASYPGKRVLTIGDELLLPEDVEAAPVRKAAISPSPELYTLLFGTDLRMVGPAFALEIGGGGDFRLETGVENLVSALQRRLLTRRGELDNHPEYGCDLDLHIGQVLDPVRAGKVRIEVTQTCLQEPRVRRISRLSIQDDDDRLAVDALLEVIGVDDVVPLNLVIPKA